ncbi:MAG TPA: glycosyltransferase [Abditibacteriaceae bacterium]|jgi:glycosyltransferase involved in cell wall biosynthesis
MIFIIIPALNEAPALQQLLPRLAQMPEIRRICVVDGGSEDGTMRVARENGALVVNGRMQNVARNRGAQMNAGVGALHAETPLAPDAVLWFLHADAQPTRANCRALQRAAQNTRICGGNFRLNFDECNAAALVFSFLARVLRTFGIYYGDSGIWLRAEVFAKIGGYPSWPLFEDYDLVRKMEQLARSSQRRTRCLWPPLVASSRRWRAKPVQTLATWATFQLLFWLGVSPFVLARRYHKK